MTDPSLLNRIRILEQKVEGLRLLPAKIAALEENVSGLRVDFQQARAENDRAHSATQTLIAEMHEHAMTRLQGVEDTMIERFDAVDRRFESMDRRFDAMDGRFDRLEGSVDSRFDRLESWLTRRFERLEERLPPRAAPDE